MTTMEAARELCYTQRGIQKMISRYKAKGDAAFVHGNRNKKRTNQEIEKRKAKIIDIITNATDDLGRRFFCKRKRKAKRKNTIRRNDGVFRR